MATGVASAFLHLLEADARSSRRRLVVLMLVAMAAGIIAWTFNATALIIYGGCLVAAAVAGYAMARGSAKDHESGLMDDWQGWMERAQASDQLDRLRGRRRRTWMALVLWPVTVGTWVAAAFGGTLQALPFALLHGVVFGVVIGAWLAEGIWSTTLRGTLLEMADDGELEVL